jgi:hypothetical protein
MAKWKLYDPEEDQYFSFEYNPSKDDGSFALNKSTAYQVNAGSYRDNSNRDNIANIIFESHKEVKKFSFSGNIYNKDEFDRLELWFSKKYDLILTDDLNRNFRIYVSSFSPSRIRSRQFPYKHSYTVKGIVHEEIFE